MITTLNISDINTEHWNELLKNSLTASFFQTRECYDFYSSLSFLKPFAFGVSENGKLLGLVCGYVIADGGKIKQFFSRRAIVPGGVLLAENISDEALQKLLDYTINSLKNKVIYIELRNYNDYSKYKNIFEKTGFKYNPHLNFHIQTTDIEEVKKKISDTKCKHIRRSLKHGAEIVETSKTEDIKSFYNIIHDFYRKKIKLPFFDYEFFEKLIKLPSSVFLSIKYEDRIIGGSVCVILPNKAVYEWFRCGMEMSGKHIYPSTLATWAGIEYAAKNGYRYFDMMGAGKPDKDYGVREYKKEFGGTLVEHGRFLYLCNNFLYRLGRFYIEKIRKVK
ncbi:hypothetical protein FACS189434_00030 [Bacteroidia bacterium]|nr:hypothetical protein FACS189434_00030 [Bacteroidia bacterium]